MAIIPIIGAEFVGGFSAAVITFPRFGADFPMFAYRFTARPAAIVRRLSPVTLPGDEYRLRPLDAVRLRCNDLDRRRSTGDMDYLGLDATHGNRLHPMNRLHPLPRIALPGPA